VKACLEHECRGVWRALRGAQRVGPWLGIGPVRPGVRAAWSEQRGFAVGNAAGEAHPILGEGISMAIQSAWLLAERLTAARSFLLAGGAQAAVGRSYAREWRRHFVARMRCAALFSAVAMRPAAGSVLRPWLRRWPSALTLGAKWGGKVRPVTLPARSARAGGAMRTGPS
jgi:flavin-dependent dehydrogenase